MQFYGKTSKMKDVIGRTFWYDKKWNIPINQQK